MPRLRLVRRSLTPSLLPRGSEMSPPNCPMSQTGLCIASPLRKLAVAKPGAVAVLKRAILDMLNAAGLDETSGLVHPVSVCRLTPDLIYTHFTPFDHSLLIASSDRVGKHVTESLPPQYLDVSMRAIEAARQTGEPQYLRGLASHGHPLVVRVHVEPNGTIVTETWAQEDVLCELPSCHGCAHIGTQIAGGGLK